MTSWYTHSWRHIYTPCEQWSSIKAEVTLTKPFGNFAVWVAVVVVSPPPAWFISFLPLHRMGSVFVELLFDWLPVATGADEALDGSGWNLFALGYTFPHFDFILFRVSFGTTPNASFPCKDLNISSQSCENSYNSKYLHQIFFVFKYQINSWLKVK